MAENNADINDAAVVLTIVALLADEKPESHHLSHMHAVF